MISISLKFSSSVEQYYLAVNILIFVYKRIYFGYCQIVFEYMNVSIFSLEVCFFLFSSCLLLYVAACYICGGCLYSHITLIIHVLLNLTICGTNNFVPDYICNNWCMKCCIDPLLCNFTLSVSYQIIYKQLQLCCTAFIQ